jgi:hypothetical protein
MMPDQQCSVLVDRAMRIRKSGKSVETRLEPVTYCNIKCPACAVTTTFVQDPVLRQKRARKLLPLPVMLDVIDQLPDLETLLYYNFGEPFLHKDTVPFLREVRRRRPRTWIATNTNGLVLTPAQIQALAAEALMDKIVFSIDGANPDSYRKYRVGGDLSKALRKLGALVEASRAAGALGRVSIIWQYILFEWNDSDEELARAKGLAEQLGVPIEWVVTSGYGASKRFVYGSPEFARLLDSPTWSMHAAAGTDLLTLELIPNRGIGEVYVYKKIAASCTIVVSTPPGVARLRAAEYSISAPAGATILFDFSVENDTGRTGDLGGSTRFRLGVLLRTAAEEFICELPGYLLPSEAGQPGGRTSAPLTVTLPEQPGQYQLIIDVVDLEGHYWFLDRGSPPLVCRLLVG